MKAFGNFFSIRGFISTLNNFSGGFVAESLNFKTVYFLSCIYPAIFCIYSIVLFKEKKVV